MTNVWMAYISLDVWEQDQLGHYIDHPEVKDMSTRDTDLPRDTNANNTSHAFRGPFSGSMVIAVQQTLLHLFR
jgi:hypothetical protein